MSHTEQVPLTELRTALHIFVAAMVDDPTAVVISHSKEQGAIRYRIQVAPTDIGKMIGKQGRTARAMRILLHGAGVKYGENVTLDIDGL